MGWSMNDFYRWGRKTIDIGASMYGIPLGDLRQGPGGGAGYDPGSSAQPSLIGGDNSMVMLVLIGVAAFMLGRK